jgi:hypothetical protein
MGIRRIRFTLILILGLTLLATAPAWSLRPVVGQQIIPDSDTGDAVGMGGSQGQEGKGTGQEHNGDVGIRYLRDLLKSWLATLKVEIPH